MREIELRLTTEEALLLNIELRNLVSSILLEFAEPQEHDADAYADRIIAIGGIAAKLESARRDDADNAD